MAVRGVLGAAAALLLGSAVQAAEEPHTFVLTAYSNARGGMSLLGGDYGAALRALADRSSSALSSAAVIDNNRCVALAVTRQWDAARAACDAAVRDAQHERNTLPTYMIWAREDEATYVAVALSNRAVLNWMSADPAAAASDLKKAESLSPHASFVTRNLSALQHSVDAVSLNKTAPQS